MGWNGAKCPKCPVHSWRDTRWTYFVQLKDTELTDQQIAKEFNLKNHQTKPTPQKQNQTKPTPANNNYKIKQTNSEKYQKLQPNKKRQNRTTYTTTAGLLAKTLTAKQEIKTALQADIKTQVQTTIRQQNDLLIEFSRKQDKSKDRLS